MADDINKSVMRLRIAAGCLESAERDAVLANLEADRYARLADIELDIAHCARIDAARAAARQE